MSYGTRSRIHFTTVTKFYQEYLRIQFVIIYNTRLSFLNGCSFNTKKIQICLVQSHRSWVLRKSRHVEGLVDERPMSTHRSMSTYLEGFRNRNTSMSHSHTTYLHVYDVCGVESTVYFLYCSLWKSGLHVG